MWGKLIRSNIAYTIGSISNGIAMLLLVPFLVNSLTIAEYGAWAIYEVTIYILITVFSLGLEVGLMRDYLFMEEDRRKQLVSTVLFASLIWGCILFGILFTLNGLVPETAIPGGSRSLAFWVPLISWLESTFLVFLSVFRIQQRAIQFAGLSFLKMFAFMFMAIALVASGMGVEGALIGRLFGSLVVIFPAMAMVRSMINFSIDRKLLVRCLSYGLPLFPYNLASYVLLASDRYILEAFATLEVVAVYAFAYKVATAIDIAVIRPFNTDWAARRFQIAKEDNAPLQYGRVQFIFPFVMVAFSLAIWSVTPLIYQLFAPSDYKTGMHLVPIILLAFIVWGMEGPMNIGIMLKDKTKHLPLVGWLAASICLALNFIFIPMYGAYGAAWTTVVAYGIHTTSIYLISQHYYSVPLKTTPLAIVVLFSFFGFLGIETLSVQLQGADVYLLTVSKLLLVLLLSYIASVFLWLTEVGFHILSRSIADK